MECHCLKLDSATTAPFWDVGFPALMITDTSFLRNPHYHQATDTPETLNQEFLRESDSGRDHGSAAASAKWISGELTCPAVWRWSQCCRTGFAASR